MLTIHVSLFAMLQLIVLFTVCCCSFGLTKEVVDKVGTYGKIGHADYIETTEKRRPIAKDEYDDFIESSIQNNKVYVSKRGHTFSPWGGKRSRMSVARRRGGSWDKEKIRTILDILELIQYGQSKEATLKNRVKPPLATGSKERLFYEQ